MKTYTQDEARLMDKELDIVHKLLTILYNYENVMPLVKETLIKIENLTPIKEQR